ncbi:5-formyltetrahydrofolate cyclo-ligase [Streptococcus rupicaprae]|uniref:5-formyltetrahydrofolate cyclo-ligase n=1 Tax=Streptococcus rupicaprae TaxID=759619 RepID=A0ABV2FI54_9STRE
MSKSALRQAVLAQLKGQDPLVKEERDQALIRRLMESSKYQKSTTVALYLSLAFEVNTASLIKAARADGKQILVPKTLKGGQMVFVPYQAGHLERSSFGVLEPTNMEVVEKGAIDLILVPGLIWNQQGYRIGFGGGFYDRYLADYEGKTVSLSYDFQIREFLPEAHDQPVEEVIVGVKNSV